MLHPFCAISSGSSFAEVLTPLTLYRNHPVEQLLQALRSTVVIGIVGGMFAWLSFGKATLLRF